MSAMTTKVAAARTISVKVTRPGAKATTFKFSCAEPNGRAAKWLRANSPITRVRSETEGVMADGGVVTTQGCQLNHLYQFQPAPAPQPTPEPEPAPQPAEKPAIPSKGRMRRMNVSDLLALGGGLGIIMDGMSKSE